MFEVKAIQAEHGDALFVSYGQDGNLHHLLIDGGPSGIAQNNLLTVLKYHKTGQKLVLEALVVTHYDLDHIQGIIELLKEMPDWLVIKDVWFNGRKHLRATDTLGAAEGDDLSKLIIERSLPWNVTFSGEAVKRRPAQELSLAGRLKIWVLSPDQPPLSALAVDWRFECSVDAAGRRPPRDILGRNDTWPPSSFANLVGVAFGKDSSVPNGSSIALMLEFEGRRALLAGDAYADVLAAGLQVYWPERPEVHLFKLSHHGSKGNVSKELLRGMKCRRFLISTNGKIHLHPDHVAISRLLANSSKPELIFNYAVPHIANWKEVPEGWPSFNSKYPEPHEPFVKVDLMTD